MGGGDKPVQQSGRSELNDMLNASPDTQFLGNQPTPTPTPQFKAELNQESENYVNPEAFTSEQRAQWEKSFDSDPNWRLNKGRTETWSYVPKEPESEQYRQGKDAMENVTHAVERLIQPTSGSFNPRAVPMRGGETGDFYEQLHFDPSRSGDKGYASNPISQQAHDMTLEILSRLGVFS